MVVWYICSWFHIDLCHQYQSSLKFLAWFLSVIKLYVIKFICDLMYFSDYGLGFNCPQYFSYIVSFILGKP
jgi:hypothetical protein